VTPANHDLQQAAASAIMTPPRLKRSTLGEPTPLSWPDELV
jgi:hypothetical protein